MLLFGQNLVCGVWYVSSINVSTLAWYVTLILCRSQQHALLSCLQKLLAARRALLPGLVKLMHEPLMSEELPFVLARLVGNR